MAPSPYPNLPAGSRTSWAIYCPSLGDVAVTSRRFSSLDRAEGAAFSYALARAVLRARLAEVTGLARSLLVVVAAIRTPPLAAVHVVAHSERAVREPDVLTDEVK